MSLTTTSGGDILKNNRGSIDELLIDLASDQRAVLNAGTNIDIHNNAQIYFDFEKSFAGKIATDYQINLGVRYSFREGSKTALPQQAKDQLPLKPTKLKTENESQTQVTETTK